MTQTSQTNLVWGLEGGQLRQRLTTIIYQYYSISDGLQPNTFQDFSKSQPTFVLCIGKFRS